MTETAFVPILVSTGVMIGAAIVGGRTARRLGLPAVLGELAAGVLLGATVLGLWLPEVHAWLFPAAGSGAVVRQTLARMGQLAFLFYAGMELDFMRRVCGKVAWREDYVPLVGNLLEAVKNTARTVAGKDTTLITSAHTQLEQAVFALRDRLYA